MFAQKRESINLVVECGLGTNNPTLASNMGVNGKPGASLRVWRDYFPNAKVIGVDIDREVLFTEDRIETYYLDQTSADSIEDFLLKLPTELAIDIIIDDGLHTFFAGKSLFENLIGRLGADGVYIIEDVTQSDLLLYMDYFSPQIDRYHVQIVNLYRPDIGLGDNSLVVVTKKCG